MNHDDHSMNEPNKSVEYSKFAGVMVLIAILSYLHANNAGASLMQYLESFMGVFFIVFASFKIYNLKEFAYGFQSYDLVAKKSLAYSYLYPFIQLTFGFVYLLGYSNITVNILVLFISLISGAGVLDKILKKQQIHCVCLGNVIKLPLSTISFVEDFGMAIMALAMLILR